MTPKKRDKDAWVHIKQEDWFANPSEDTIIGYSRKSKYGPKNIKEGANCMMRVYVAERYGYNVETK